MRGNEQFSLRPATPGDVDFIFDLRVKTMKEYYEATSGWRPDDQMAMAGDELEHARIVTVANTPIGVIKVIPRERDLHLHQIQVLPEFQAKGLGAELIRGVFERAEEAGLPVTLYVLKGNPARGLYERLGFVVMEEHEHAFSMCRQVP